VLSYGLGDLQDAGLLSGQHWLAFGLTAHVDPNSWWISIITGVTELSPKMTVLQVVAWVVYLAMVIPVFIRAARPTAVTRPLAGADAPKAVPPRWEHLAAHRPWAVAGALVMVPAVAAGAAIAALPAPPPRRAPYGRTLLG
jgi:high-affinity iron transporter